MAIKCCEIKAGDLRHFITVNQLTTTDDGQGGGGIPDYTTQRYQAWAKMKQLSSGEAFRRHRLESDQIWEFSIRYNATVADTIMSDQIVYRGVQYNIRKLHNLEMRDIWLVMAAESGVPQG